MRGRGTGIGVLRRVLCPKGLPTPLYARIMQAGLNNNRSCGSWTNWVSRAPLRLLGELHYGTL